jgi:uncharacterized membrane protein YhaH (DUF805 family)
LTVLKKYADFKGRATRTEYWMFFLFHILFAIAALVLDNVLGLTSIIQGGAFGLLYILYGLAVLIPGFAVMVRRLHDVGKSGWMCLISMIPLIGSIWLLVLLASDSVPGTNKYGPNPKDAGIDYGSGSKELGFN